jgi:hypothetical protein
MWLLLKRNLYFRPNAQGYTGIKDHAGRYPLDEAKDWVRDGIDGISMISEADAPEFTEACYNDLAIKHLQSKLTSEREARVKAEEDAKMWREAFEHNATTAASAVAASLEIEEVAFAASQDAPASAVRATAVLIERDDDAFIVSTDSFPVPNACIARKPRPLSNEEWRPRAQMIIDALAPVPQATENPENEYRDALSAISSFLGAGLGDDSTSADDFYKRIRWGIDNHVSCTFDFCAAIVERLSNKPNTTWGEVKAEFMRKARETAPTPKAEGEQR